VLKNIDSIQKNREERRKKAESAAEAKNKRQEENAALGKYGDVEFMQMVEEYRNSLPKTVTHVNPHDFKIYVCVRKRPLFAKEENRGEIDATTLLSPKALIHEPKFKVDGITKYLQNQEFTFDNTFNESEDSSVVYQYSLKPMTEFVANRRGTVTCFAYGQTGSGKTFTMVDL
jgi:kinesin family protein 2/24